jgi:DNA polymerase delta subunit 1
MYNSRGMVFTFQHVATSRYTNRGKSSLALYGRTAAGKSVAVHVLDIKPYGFIKANMHWWRNNSPYIMEYANWISAGERLEQMKKWGNPRQMADYRDRLFKEDDGNIGFYQMNGDTVRVSETCGYNIREVHESKEDTFLRIEADSGHLLSTIIRIIRAPDKAITKVLEARKKIKRVKVIVERRPKEDPKDWLARFESEKARVKMPDVTPWPTEYDQPDIFETHLGEDLVWMIDNRTPSCAWFEVAGETQSPGRSTCDINLEVDCNIRSHFVRLCKNPPQPMAPFVILSYDIESQPHVVPGQTETLFPEPDRDPILCIGCSVFNMVDLTTKQYCFMYENSPRSDGIETVSYPPLIEEEQTDEYRQEEVDVRSYKTEYEMLMAYREFIQDEIDPDIITGYNILNFDNVYTINRANHLHNMNSDQPKAWCWGRIKDRECNLKSRYTWTAQKGGRTTWECKMEGREFMDVYKIVMDDHKLRSYKMDEVAAEFLGTRKIHISYDDIPKMQLTQKGRIRLGGYCAKDAWIPNKIIIKMSKAINAILMSQVTGVSLNTILNRGQQIRTISLMLSKCKERKRDHNQPRWFLPDEDDPPDTGSFEGAVVISPIPGFWPRPVATLDFASLYPSIMRAWNMCFSTIISNHSEAKRRGYKWEPSMENPSYRPVRTFNYPDGGKFEYQTKENDICFITAEKRKGILPEILAELHSSRKLAKRQMKACKEGSMEYNVLDGRQLALKVCMNSVYGFTGASKGFLPEKRIASAVTRAGRGMANETKFMCEDRYKEHGVKVVYGDTDSVFVHFPKSLCPGETTEEIIKNANKIGEEMGEMCTKAFLPPNDLEFEKVYYPLLLKGKKRYAGYKFEPGCKPKLDVKGFECVRRDFAPIVSKTQKKVFVLLCQENNVDAAVQYARQTVVDLLEGRIPIEDLTLSKQLTRPPDQYKNPQPHVELAKWMQKHLPPTQAPKTGDRINYIIKPGRGKTFERAALPQDVVDGKCSVDTRWYLDNQLREPLTRVFDMVIDNTHEIFKIDKFAKPSVGTDSVFSGWVSKKKTSENKRKAVDISVKRKGTVKKKKQVRLSNFFG